MNYLELPEKGVTYVYQFNKEAQLTTEIYDRQRR